MPQFFPSLDEEPLVDGSSPIAGVDNARPPSVIDQSMAADAENRLTQQDGLNRPRPGLLRLQKPASSLDSIHHLGTGLFLCNNGGSWFTYDSRSNVLATVSGGPSYSIGSQVYSALANDTLYFSIGTTLNKYKPGTGFGTVALPSPYLTSLYPLWAFERLSYVFENSIIVSDIMDPEVFDVATQSVTLDPIKSDYITGIARWQNQTMAVFRNGSTWILQTGPNLPVLYWQLDRASSTVGCCSHGSIMQCGTDVYFLSETGRGVYALSQMPTSNQQGVWVPISAPIKRYIDRINWTYAKVATATYWNDLYMLSVPLDGSTFNNFLLIYSVNLQTWQGLWCYDVDGIDTAVRDFARDRTNPDKTVLLYALRDGTIAQCTYPADRKYYDQNIDTTRVAIKSTLLSRAFTFTQDLNQIQPQSAKIQFIESEDPVDVTVWGDRTIQLLRKSTPTNNYLLSLTIPGFPFDLDKEGFYNLQLSLMSVGVCSELQLEFEGVGNWTLFQMKLAAWGYAPLVAI